MPQILGLVLIGAGVIAGYRAVRSLAQRVHDAMQQAADSAKAASAPASAPAEKDLGKLELDPATGEYRPSSL